MYVCMYVCVCVWLCIYTHEAGHDAVVNERGAVDRETHAVVWVQVYEAALLVRSMYVCMPTYLHFTCFIMDHLSANSR